MQSGRCHKPTANLIKQFGIHEISALENLWEEIVRETQAKHNVRAWLESQGTIRNELEDLVLSLRISPGSATQCSSKQDSFRRPHRSHTKASQLHKMWLALKQNQTSPSSWLRWVFQSEVRALYQELQRAIYKLTIFASSCVQTPTLHSTRFTS